MRMWMLPPSLLCRKHLLGEHYELHKLAGHLRRRKRLGRFLTDGLVDPSRIYERHEELVGEMLRRGYSHGSPIVFPEAMRLVRGGIDVAKNEMDLRARCAECRERFERAAETTKEKS